MVLYIRIYITAPLHRASRCAGHVL